MTFYIAVNNRFRDFNENGFINEEDSEILEFPYKHSAINYLYNNFNDIIVERENVPVSMSFSGEFVEIQPGVFSPKFIFEPLLTAHEMHGNPLFY